MTGLGVPDAVVDEMDTRRLMELIHYWETNPPPSVALIQLRDVVISGLGGTPPGRAKAQASRQQSFDEFMASVTAAEKKGKPDA